jgi:hypothetical protein
LQDLDLHHQLADAPVGLVKLLGDRIVLPLLEARIDASQRPVPPLLELVYRYA